MILVTGATGFVGRHLVPALGTRLSDTPIRILSRTMARSDVLPDGVRIFRGDLEDAQGAAAAVRGTEVVIHLAAKVQPDAREVEQMRRVNVEGARNLYRAAIAAGSRLFVHMSSAGIYGPPRSGDPFREDDAPNPSTPYQVTKFEAEDALGQIDPKETALNILRPAGIYGSGSFLELDIYNRVLGQRWSIEPSGGVVVHPTHVRDIVEGIIALIERPASGGTVFNLGGERPILVQDLFALVAETLGVGRRRIVLPRSVAGPLGGMAEGFFSLIGRPKPFLAGMSQGHRFNAAVDDHRFRQCYPTVPIISLTEGLREHIDWARANRLLRLPRRVPEPSGTSS
jgi:nucleoside-diphosphate-sugar epimerase